MNALYKIDQWFLWFVHKWNDLIKDNEIRVKSLELPTPYILVINFTCNGEEMYVDLHSDYRSLKTKLIRKTQENPNITLMDDIDEISLFMPIEDVINQNKMRWKRKAV